MCDWAKMKLLEVLDNLYTVKYINFTIKKSLANLFMIWCYLQAIVIIHLNFLCGNFYLKTDRLKMFADITEYSRTVLYISSHSYKWSHQRHWGTCILLAIHEPIDPVTLCVEVGVCAIISE